MKLWLASTDANAVAQHFELGLFAGVLTNPTMLAQAKRPPLATLGDLCTATSAPVYFQLKDGTVDEQKRQADQLLGRGWKNLGIKVALTREGCAVLHWLREQGIRQRLATAVPTTATLLLATALEVPRVTPSGSALEKIGGPSKLTLLTEMQATLDRQQSPTVLIPSLASPAEMAALALAGLREGFVWDRDVARFVDHELVRQTVAGFAPAWTALESAAPSHY